MDDAVQRKQEGACGLMPGEEAWIFERKQGNGFRAEPADDLRGGLVQLNRSGADELEKLFVGIVAQRSKGAIDSRSVEELFPSLRTKLSREHILEHIKNDSF